MILSPLQIILIALVIIVIGILGNIAGFGGGVILVPLLSLLFNIPLKIVIGTTIAGLVLPSLIGFLGAWKRKEVDFKLGLSLEVPTIIGVIIGSHFTSIFSDQTLQVIFGVLAFGLFIFMLRNTQVETDPQKLKKKEEFWGKVASLPPMYVIEKENYTYRLSIPLVIVAGLAIGFFAGLLGIGGGWIKNPLLILGFGLPPVIGSGTALFMLTITTFSGGISHYLAGNFRFSLFLVITISQTIGAVLGDYLKTEIKSKHISYIVSSTLGIIGSIMFSKVFGII